MLQELWEKYKGKVAIGALALLLGLPAVQATTGLGVQSKDDGQVCIGFVSKEEPKPEVTAE